MMVKSITCIHVYLAFMLCLRTSLDVCKQILWRNWVQNACRVHLAQRVAAWPWYADNRRYYAFN